MKDLFDITERQIKSLLHSKRANVLFYDHKRNELFRRQHKDGSDTIESISCIKVGHKAINGLGSISIHTLSTIYSNVIGDPRFWKPIDDPKGDESDPPTRAVSIPIVKRVEENSQENVLPKGVVIAINKEGQRNFSTHDVSIVKAYNNLVTRVIDIAAYFLVI